MHDVALDPTPRGSSAVTSVSTSKSDDYVWDVFYHRPATLSEWNEAANVGTLCVLALIKSAPFLICDQVRTSPFYHGSI